MPPSDEAHPSAVRLRWQPVPDECASDAVLAGDAPVGLSELAVGLAAPESLDASSLGPSRMRFYFVRADGDASGPGPTGR